MTQNTDYISVGKIATAEYIEKKSRFIATVYPINSEEEAFSLINAEKKKYWDARHTCYAFRLKAAVPYEKYGDDGEPSGTAGLPILDVLKGREVLNCLITVTRYFGGVLLGTGGLVRAYSTSAKQALENGGLVKKLLYRESRIAIDYSLLGKIEHTIEKKGYIQGEKVFTDKVGLSVFTPEEEAESFALEMENITNGALKAEKGDIKYIEVPL
ncbi:MAG: YigZ family protein [Firmicutes bacterium]|nr:YigZ family protein [Bacillota bacterium]